MANELEFDVGTVYTVEILSPSSSGNVTSIELVDSTYIPAPPGEDGADGDPGQIGPPGEDAPQWEGQWDVNKNYAKDSIVEYKGSTYISKVDISLKNKPTDTAYWDLFAAKGDSAPKWAGAWEENATYSIDDIILFEDNLYIANTYTNTTPPGDDWSLFLPKGADGPIWEGTWVPTIGYRKNSIVKYYGTVYIALRDLNVGNSVLNPVDWEVVMVNAGYIMADVAETIDGTIDDKVVNPYTLSRALGYVHNHPTPEDTWIVDHPLNRLPKVSVIDSAGTEVEGAIKYISNKRLIISFSGGFSGNAYLS